MASAILHQPTLFLYPTITPKPSKFIHSCTCKLTSSLSSPLSPCPTMFNPNNNSTLAILPLSPNFTSDELLNVLKSQKHPSMALKMLKCATKQNAYICPSIYEFMICRLGFARHFGQMHEVLRLMRPPTERAFLCMIKSYTKFHMVDEAFAVLRDMEVRRLEPSKQCYKHLLIFFVRENNLNMLESLCSQMRSSGIQPDIKTFTILIKALCRANKMDLALDLLKQMSSNHGFVPNEIAYNILIRGFLKRGRMKDALEISKEMESNGFIPSTNAYNALLHWFCQQGAVEEAISLLEEMCGRGFCPDIVTFNTIINGFCKQGSLEEAAKLLEELCGSSFCPNTVTFNIIINGFCKQGRQEEAAKLLEKMCGSGLYPNTVTFNGFCKAIIPDKVAGLMEKMVEGGFKPDAITYNTLVSGLCKARKYQEARRLVDEMVGRDCVPDVVTYNSMIHAMCKDGRVEEAIYFFDELTAKGYEPDRYTHDSIFWLCKDGNLNAALKFIEHMLARGCIPDSKTYNVLLKRVFREEVSEQAMQLLRQMKAVRYYPNSSSVARNRRVIDHHILKPDSEETSVSEAVSGMLQMVGQIRNKQYKNKTSIQSSKIIATFVQNNSFLFCHN